MHQHLHGHFTLPHHLCVSPSIPSPLCFSITHPFLVCVCVALSSGIHALFVGVDALALSSVPLIWGTPCLPSTTACVVMAFLHCPGPVNHLPLFLCVSLGSLLWKTTTTKHIPLCQCKLKQWLEEHTRRHHEETHTRTLCFLSFSLFTFFFGAFGRQ